MSPLIDRFALLPASVTIVIALMALVVARWMSAQSRKAEFGRASHQESELSEMGVTFGFTGPSLSTSESKSQACRSQWRVRAITEKLPNPGCTKKLATTVSSRVSPHTDDVDSPTNSNSRPTAAPWRAADANAGVSVGVGAFGSPPADPAFVEHVVATSEFALSRRHSEPRPRQSRSSQSSPAAEYADRFCAWVIASGGNGQEFAFEDVYRLALRFAELTSTLLPQPDEDFFAALAGVHGVDKAPHRPCAVHRRLQRATTTYTIYSAREVELVLRSRRRARRDVRPKAVATRI